jgi:hypothetical protein
MEQRIPGKHGTTTVVTDSYGFGSIAVGPAEPPDDPARYVRKVFSERELCARYGVTPETLLGWCGEGPLAFPRPRVMKVAPPGTWDVFVRREWDQEPVIATERAILDFAGRIPKR